MESDQDYGSSHNGFREVWEVLCHRTKAPLLHFTYWGFMLLGVIFFGGAGIWYELIHFDAAHIDSLKSALLTFPPAIIGGAGMQLVFERGATNQLRMFAIIMVFLVLLILFLVKASLETPAYIFTSILCAIASLWVWWIANALNGDLKDNIDPQAPIGGDATQDPPGKTDGFTV